MSKPIKTQPQYNETIVALDEGYKILKTMRPLPEAGIRYFLNEFSISATHSSNAIEGNTFTYDETKLLLERGIAIGAHSFRENQDIVGYKKGFDYLYTALKENQPITEEFIKKIHSCVLLGDEEAGWYRTIQNFVGTMTKIVYTPCPPREVPSKMADYATAVNADMEKNKKLIQSGNIDWTNLLGSLGTHHIEFENIHPFIDGNGRTGRLLLSYEMISLGLLPVDIRYEHRDRYYAAISAYRDKEKYSTRLESKTEKMVKLLADCELTSIEFWNKIFLDYQNLSNPPQGAESEIGIKNKNSALKEILRNSGTEIPPAPLSTKPQVSKTQRKTTSKSSKKDSFNGSSL